MQEIKSPIFPMSPKFTGVIIVDINNMSIASEVASLSSIETSFDQRVLKKSRPGALSSGNRANTLEQTLSDYD